MDGEAAHKGHHVSKVGAKANKKKKKKSDGSRGQNFKAFGVTWRT